MSTESIKEHGEGVRREKGWEEVLEFWFGGDIEVNFSTKWFTDNGSPQQASVDTAVKERFGELLSEAERGTLDEWASFPKGRVALILVLDQFSRHFYRSDAHRDTRVKQNDQQALILCEEGIALKHDEHLVPSEAVFMLMPYRHTATLERLDTVLRKVSSMIALNSSYGSLLKRFHKVTLTRRQHLEGQQWGEGMEILEKHPFDADDSTAPDHPIYISFKKFMEEEKADQYPSMAVSLSGGVDSMVILQLLIYLKRNENKPWNIVAIHINYRNRPEADTEADFLCKWCNSHSILYRQRSIEEMQRATTTRDLYEKATRDIRFKAYLESMSESGHPSVFFGHHQGDIQENVLTNIMKRTQLLDISGMGRIGIVNGVPIWRPLLPHVKDEIFDFAHKFGVPYFLDTTPSWSTRGTMRNQLMPLLKGMFGEGYLRNLSALSKQSSELSDLLDRQIFGPFLQSLTDTPIAVHFDCLPHKDAGIFFWREALKQLMHNKLREGLISDSPIQEQIIQRLQFHGTEKQWRDGFVRLRKDCYFYMVGSHLFGFRRGLFGVPTPFAQGEEIFPNRNYTFGVFDLFCEVVDRPPSERRVSPAEAVSESFTYEMPFLDSPLVIKSKDRCKTLRAVPIEITNIMPIVNYKEKVEGRELNLGKAIVVRINCRAP